MSTPSLSQRCTLAAAALALTLTGCAADTESGSDPVAATPTQSGTPMPREPAGPASPDASFEVRQVVAVAESADSDPSTADGIVVADDTGGFLEVGPVVLDAGEVKAASASNEGGRWAVNVDFTPKGSKAFEHLSAEAACSQDPVNQIALLVDGQVVSNATVQVPCGSSISGSTQISGDFDRPEAEALVARIAGE